MELNTFKGNMPWPYLILLFIVSLIVIFGGFLFYKSQKRRILYEKQNELATIISLKTNEIAKWRMEHLRDGEIISNDLPLIKQISSYFENEEQTEKKQELLLWMELFIKDYDYEFFYLLDDTKTIRLSYPQDSSASNSLSDPFPEITDHRKVNITDLHFSNKSSGIHINLVIPLISTNNTFIGTAVLCINPEITLFPLIQSWPSLSKSSETLLLKLDGDSVIFLNELRHQKNTVLKLKFPLSKNTLPAAMAVKGYEGTFEGLDYRNIPVISYLKKVPHSPWFMVAKVDKEEIYSPLNEQIALISVIIFLIILSVSVMIGYFLRIQSIRFLQELNTTKDKFFSIIFHDLRSPFNSILGFSKLLIDRIKDQDFKETEKFAAIINDSSQHVMDLLTNLAQWSRLQTGRMKFYPKEVDIVSIINESCDLISASASQKSISLTRNIPLNLKIIADEAMISSVLRNLISNSIKFSKPGSEIYISAVQKENDIMVVVEDNGVGISKDILARLFLIEEKISTPGTLNEEGTGLGLILCKEFISIHRGKIWAESEVGKGSKFIFTLPI